MEHKSRHERKKQENMVASQTLKTGGNIRERSAEEIQKTKRERKITSHMLAESDFCKINFYHPALKANFPGNGKLWSVDKFYPYAKGGPLFVDEPRFPYEIKNCEMKLDAFDKHNEKANVHEKVRYLILHNGVDPLNDVEGIAN